MTSNTIVGCFDDLSEARAVETELAQAGIPAGNIHLLANDARRQPEEPTFWQSVKETFGFTDESDRGVYGEAARRGGTIVSVDAPENETDRAVDIMKRHHAIDLDERSDQWRRQGWAPYAGSAQRQSQSAPAKPATPANPAPMAKSAAPAAIPMPASGHPAQSEKRFAEGPAQREQQVIPVVQEELQIGKRQIRSGGVRVYSRVTEKPVEGDIHLREEHVNVQRRTVDRPIRAGDQPFRDRVIEATEMREEPVISKQAHVVEEVVINKDVRERDQKVSDTVRRTDVDVEPEGRSQAAASQAAPKQPASAQPVAGENALFSSDAFVTGVLADSRYRGKSFEMIEPDLRRDFEKRYPSDSWAHHREAIRQRLARK